MFRDVGSFLGYTRQQLAACEGATIPDLIAEDCRLLFVGINPGLQTAMTGIHFAHPSNRFWPALRRAGIIDWLPDVSPVAPSVRLGITAETVPVRGVIGPIIDGSGGMTDRQRAELTNAGIGITNLVERATARASDLRGDELRAGAVRLESLVEEVGPRIVAVAGVSAYRVAFTRPAAVIGLQPESLAHSELWVVPNPSGLNAHETIDSLAIWYRKLSEAAS
jgi:TDG/mug DNA glycosylase family protein